MACVLGSTDSTEKNACHVGIFILYTQRIMTELIFKSNNLRLNYLIP